MVVAAGARGVMTAARRQSGQGRSSEWIRELSDGLDAEAPFVPPPGFHLTLSCLMLALFLGALNQTIVAAALPTIGKAFGDVGNLSWVISAYFLFGTAVAPILGKLSDIYGRRLLILWSIGLFVAGSIVCALAPNMRG